MAQQNVQEWHRAGCLRSVDQRWRDERPVYHPGVNAVGSPFPPCSGCVILTASDAVVGRLGFWDRTALPRSQSGGWVRLRRSGIWGAWGSDGQIRFCGPHAVLPRSRPASRLPIAPPRTSSPAGSIRNTACPRARGSWRLGIRFRKAAAPTESASPTLWPAGPTCRRRTSTTAPRVWRPGTATISTAA
ncbi:hypothetical protein ABIF44_000970 [Bradyrhizobium japonicum]